MLMGKSLVAYALLPGMGLSAEPSADVIDAVGPPTPGNDAPVIDADGPPQDGDAKKGRGGKARGGKKGRGGGGKEDRCHDVDDKLEGKAEAEALVEYFRKNVKQEKDASEEDAKKAAKEAEKKAAFATAAAKCSEKAGEDEAPAACAAEQIELLTKERDADDKGPAKHGKKGGKGGKGKDEGHMRPEACKSDANLAVRIFLHLKRELHMYSHEATCDDEGVEAGNKGGKKDDKKGSDDTSAYESLMGLYDLVVSAENEAVKRYIANQECHKKHEKAKKGRHGGRGGGKGGFKKFGKEGHEHGEKSFMAKGDADDFAKKGSQGDNDLKKCAMCIKESIVREPTEEEKTAHAEHVATRLQRVKDLITKNKDGLREVGNALDELRANKQKDAPTPAEDQGEDVKLADDVMAATAPDAPAADAAAAASSSAPKSTVTLLTASSDGATTTDTSTQKSNAPLAIGSTIAVAAAFAAAAF